MPSLRARLRKLVAKWTKRQNFDQPIPIRPETPPERVGFPPIQTPTEREPEPRPYVPLPTTARRERDYDPTRQIVEFRPESEVDENWELAFDMMPLDHLSNNQIEYALKMIDNDLAAKVDWDVIYEDVGENFWEWYRTNYTRDFS